jgi:hypothetical protein
MHDGHPVACKSLSAGASLDADDTFLTRNLRDRPVRHLAVADIKQKAPPMGSAGGAKCSLG